MLKNGIIIGFVFIMVYKSSSYVLFSVVSEIDMVIVVGKVCMDRNCFSVFNDCVDIV